MATVHHAPADLVKVWTCTDHDTPEGVKAAAVIVAPTWAQAVAALRKELGEAGMHMSGFTLEELDTSKVQALVLDNGE